MIGDASGVVSVRTVAARLDVERLGRDHLVGRLEPGDHVLLSVSDTGHGLDANARKRAFDAFYTSKGPGRGIGLAMVSGVVDAHRGAIAVESQPGRGSVFRVWLPAARPGAGRTRA